MYIHEYTRYAYFKPKYNYAENHRSYILVPVPKPVPVPKGVFVEDPNISKANEHNLS